MAKTEIEAIEKLIANMGVSIQNLEDQQIKSELEIKDLKTLLITIRPLLREVKEDNIPF